LPSDDDDEEELDSTCEAIDCLTPLRPLKLADEGALSLFSPITSISMSKSAVCRFFHIIFYSVVNVFDLCAGSKPTLRDRISFSILLSFSSTALSLA
jgi:hypothetical protein